VEPVPIRPDAPWRPRAEPLFVLGVAIGAIPLVIWLVVLGIASAQSTQETYGTVPNLTILLDGLALAGLTYLVMIVAALRLAANEATRVVGLGALAAILASPVIAFMGCSVIPSLFR
jgi:hypothetical protein